MKLPPLDEENKPKKKCFYCDNPVKYYASNLLNGNWLPVCEEHKHKPAEDFEKAYEEKKDNAIKQRAIELEEKANRGKKPTFEDTVIINLFLKGSTRKEIAKMFEMSYQSIKERIIKYRDKGWISEEQLLELENKQKQDKQDG